MELVAEAVFGCVLTDFPCYVYAPNIHPRDFLCVNAWRDDKLNRELRGFLADEKK
jgi:hypothetical protein